MSETPGYYTAGSQINQGRARIDQLERALREMLGALAAHSVTLGAVIDHMTQHECFCPGADALYAADGDSGELLRAAADSAQAALTQSEEGK